MPGAVYSPSGGRDADASVDVCPLNVGDTWMEPFAGARMQDLREASHPGLHRYSPTQGVPQLVDAIGHGLVLSGDGMGTRQRSSTPSSRTSSRSKGVPRSSPYSASISNTLAKSCRAAMYSRINPPW